MARTQWQDLYVIEQTAALTTNPSMATTDIGFEGTGAAGYIGLMPLTNHPHLVPASSTLETELAVGRSERYFLEYNQTIANPATVTLEMLANAYNVSLFLWLLFQSGTTETDTGGTNKMACSPYTSADPEIYAAITRILGGTAGNADTYSQYLEGCICNSLTLRAEQGGLLTLSAEMMGANWAVANNDLGSVTYSTLTFSSQAPLKFQDCTFTLGGTEIDIPSFEITINNNAAPQFYNNTSIQAYVLGRLSMEGSFGVPWGEATEGGNKQLQDFVDGVDKTFAIEWGDVSANTDASFQISGNLRHTDTDFGGEGELVTTVNYSCVNDGTNAAILVEAVYDETRLDRGVA